MLNCKLGVFLFVLTSSLAADKDGKAVFGPPDACAGWTAVTNCVLAAFDAADVVALHDRHRQKGDSDLRIALVRDPMFPKRVRDIVVEFGNSRYQAILDRYIAGEDVKISEVEPVPGEFIKSSGNRRLVQPATVLLPAIRSKVYR